MAVSLCALLVFPFFFLSSFAYAGVLVVLTAVAGALLLLPAALARWGHRVERPEPAVSGFWQRVALAAMRRPVAAGAAVVGVLLLAASPLLGLRFGLPDERTLPTGTSSRTTSETIHEEFPAEPTATVQVVLREAASAQDTRTYAAELSRIQGAFQVDAPTGSYQDGRRTGPSPITPGAPGRDGDGGAAGEHAGEDAGEEAGSRLAVVPTQAAMYGDVPAFVDAVRDTPAPVPALVCGYPAETTDFRATLLDRARSTEATAPAPGSARRRGEWKGTRGTPAGVRVIATLG